MRLVVTKNSNPNKGVDITITVDGEVVSTHTAVRLITNCDTSFVYADGMEFTRAKATVKIKNITSIQVEGKTAQEIVEAIRTRSYLVDAAFTAAFPYESEVAIWEF